MKKTRLIPIVIVFIMIMNCLLPVLPVKATTNKAIILNGELYNAVKEQLNEQNITASYNDSQRRIVISESELLKVTSMDLSDSQISDILGLENFANIISLDLSGNELTSESNLDVLSGLKLEFLDLSSNKIEDVSMITNFSEISEINLHGQIISTVEVISLDTSPDSDHKARLTIKLPQILSLEEIDPNWLDAVFYEEDQALKPIWTSLSRDENNVPTLTLDVAGYDGNIEQYLIHDGALKITINIGNTGTELEDSSMSLFFVVIDQEQRAAIFKDDNFYNVVKDQLTKGKNNINSDLRTYNGGDTLYLKAYDEAKVMVFDFNTLVNEIPTLKASNYKISDISGIETFIGLEDMIDLSYNYIDSIDKILELQENKNIETEKLQAKFAKQINEVIAPIRKSLVEHLNAIEAIEEQIEAAIRKIATITEAIAKIEEELQNPDLTEDVIKSKNSEIEKKAKEKDAIQALLEDNGYWEGEKYIPSLPELKRDEVAKANEYLLMLKPQMDKLYEIYNKEYKATSFVTVELYDIDTNEFNYLTKDEAKTMLNNLISKIEKLESSKSISEFEKTNFKAIFNYPEEDVEKNKITNPISSYLKQEVAKLEKRNADAGDYKKYILEIMTVDVVSQMIYNFPSLYLTYEYDEHYVGGYTSLTDNEAYEISREVLKVFMEDAGEKVTSAYEKFAEEEWNSYYTEQMILSAKTVDTVDVEEESDEEKALSQILGLSGKFVNLTEEEIVRWITLPALENVNLQNNMIEDIDGIEALTELEELNISENEIVVINNIDWAKLTELKVLDLHFNFISDISKLASAGNLVNLNVANNLLSGKFNLNISKLNNLKVADFSQNAYTDIENLITQYILIAKDAGVDVNEYIMNKVDIKLHSQNISINLDEKILIGSGDSEIIREVKLPPIIKQFEQLDSKRTVFGTQSIYGKISADGKVGLIISNEIGNHSGLVTVDTKDYSEGLSVGHGTTCKINYTVTAATVNDVLISMDRENAIRGGKTQFEAYVDAVNVWDTTVSWTVEGQTSNDTRIDENGLLTVGEDETAEKLTIRATSNYDNSKYLDMKVNVVDADVKVTVVTTPNEKGIVAGTSKVYEAVVETEAENKEVSWSVSGNTSENTVINRQGVLTIGKDEAHGAKITVRATSDYNSEVSDYVVEVVVVEQGNTPVVPNPGDTTNPVDPNPGDTNDIDVKYETKDEFIYASKPGMTIEEFVTGLFDGEHTVVVSDGEGNRITDYTGKVSSGMVICIDDSIENTYEIIVTGDVNNDGKVNSMDSNIIKAHRVETSKIEGVSLEAADINKDGKVNKIDSFLLLYYRADKIQDFTSETIENVMK